ncbi:hypothetical protein OG946_13695 [Streptomyces sp. NBC_01808]|uniref:hypothetical protein n=1 Tax=Streptomyces sp. NBC_01808 TaxID=2975947 RepID=UPI002DDA3EA0|nr:hypothetical protein [Streptomyces sp. NBC_01808]WSA38334.1 hypothetical protein OG946_13695 [Streptomyces sp. NBC_01808]
MRKIRKFAVGAAVAVSSIAMAAGPATADPSTVWTVGPGSPQAFNAVSSSTKLELNGILLTCTNSTASGTLSSKTGNPAAVGNIAAVAFNNCTTPFGPLNVDTVEPWSLNAADYSAGVTKGNIGNVTAKLAVLACTFDVVGKASGNYSNATGKLTVDSLPGELLVANSVNCGDIAKNGDKPSFDSVYDVTIPGGGKPSIVGSNPPS